MELIRRLIHEEDGQTYVEYGILVAMIGIAVAVGGFLVTGAIKAWYNDIGNWLTTNAGAG